MTLALRAYAAFAQAIAPLWRWVLRRRLGRGKETVDSIRQKLVQDCAARPQGVLVWGHAVGVGEVLALAGLFRQLGQRLPHVSFLITSSARSSAVVLSSGNLPARCVHQFAPIDTPLTVERFLDHWRPSLAIWCEMDLWPNTLTQTARRGIASVLVNARLSERSHARRQWGRWLYRPVLQGLHSIWAQNQDSARALLDLGARPSAIHVTGTIKTLAVPLGHDPAELVRWRGFLGSRPIWLLASSHAGEEMIGLSAHQRLLRLFPEALLIIAPRYPARGAEIQALCPEGTLLRSRDRISMPGGQSVYVADTLGEMGLWYRLASISLVGGSLVAVGGHNPFEPLALGCAVLHGPEVSNFAESYADLDARGASACVADAAELERRVADHWQAPGALGARVGGLPDWSERLAELERLLPVS